MSERIKLRLPIIVEGRYDKAALAGYIDGVIITTGGFSLFNNKEKQTLIRRIASEGIIILTDSDGGGRQIRSFLSGIIPKDTIHHAFIPQIEGKEKRKAHPSRSGVLGVEGMSREILVRVLRPFLSDNQSICPDGFCVEECKRITMADMFSDGLCGCEGAAQKRALLCALCDLPTDMSAKALLEAMNLIYGYDQYKSLLSKI